MPLFLPISICTYLVLCTFCIQAVAVLSLGSNQNRNRTDLAPADEMEVGGVGGEGVRGGGGVCGSGAMNPLDPCGACMKWLRKIGEVNPDLKVVTFTDTSCNKVVVTPIDYWQ